MKKKRKELKILGLSYSQTQVGSYVIVLSDINGKRKLPLIIKQLEAQRIALEIEGIKSPRPLTHDLFKFLTDSYGIDIQEIFIYSLLEGIFYTKIITTNGVEEYEIDCTAGDALALSAIYKCPIFITQEILSYAGVVISDNGDIGDIDEIEDKVEDVSEPKERIISIDNLEKMMEEAISREEYEIAAEIRDRIKIIKDQKKG